MSFIHTRTVFPSVEISQVTRPDGLQDVIYQGVMKRPPVHKGIFFIIKSSFLCKGVIVMLMY